MQRHEEVRLVLVGQRGPVLERDRAVAATGQHDARPQFVLQVGPERLGDPEREVLFGLAGRSPQAVVRSAMARIEDDPELAAFLLCPRRRTRLESRPAPRDVEDELDPRRTAQDVRLGRLGERRQADVDRTLPHFDPAHEGIVQAHPAARLQDAAQQPKPHARAVAVDLETRPVGEGHDERRGAQVVDAVHLHIESAFAGPVDAKQAPPPVEVEAEAERFRVGPRQRVDRYEQLARFDRLR